MVIERFKKGKFNEVYARFDQSGRMLPDGLYYLNSWVNEEQSLCFQLMETNNRDLFDEWIKSWNDLTEFEIIPLD